jgi:hypothetical protein
MTFSELQTIINAHRKARGLTVKPIPQDITNLENLIKKYQNQYDQAARELKTPQELTDINRLLEPAKRRLRQEIEKYQGR